MTLNAPRSPLIPSFVLLMLPLLLTGCGGGDNDSNTKSYTVAVGATKDGTLSPTSQQMKEGATATVTVTPNSGFNIASVNGCGGTLSGNIYTTAPITADCEITASFNLVLNVSSTAPDTLTFSWSAYPGADHYKLLVSRDGAADYAQAGSDITGSSVDVSLPGELLDWINAKYMLQAYDSSNTQIASSAATGITNLMLSQPGSSGTNDDLGWSATLSKDGKTLVVGTPGKKRSNKTASAAGEVYLFQRDPATGNWTKKAYVKNDRDNRWASHIDLEAKLGNKRSIGEADLFVPLTQNSHSLLFTDLRGRFDDKSSHEFNLGLGLRRMKESGWNLGLYGYLDRRTSQNGYDYDQATLGVEALGTNWDFRTNGYAPFGTHAHDLGTTSSASLAGASIQIETDIHEERALSGLDAEVGWRTPLYDAEAARQLRLYAGGYRFSGGGLTVQGPRLRAELEMDDLSWFGGTTRLYVGAEVQRDDTRGTQGFVSARLRIPLGGRGEQPHLSLQERRMTAPVVRDVDVLTVDHIAREVEIATTTSGQSITVVNSATTAGADLPNAVAAAGANSTVILSGIFNTTATTTLQSGQTVIGSGSLAVKSASGHTATLALTGATVNATIGGFGPAAANPAFMMANNSTIDGLNVSLTRSGGVGTIGVYFTNVSGATIRNSTITATETGANAADGVVVGDATSNITVSGNTISAVAQPGQSASAFLLVNGGGGAAATVTGNTLSATGGTNNWAVFLNGGTFNAGSTGNVKSAGTCHSLGGTGILYFTDGTTCP